MLETTMLLSAVRFAAEKHRDQRRKGAEASPYINHPIEVADLLAGIGGVTDIVTLQAAVLHDTLEDTETTPTEIAEAFGSEVLGVVKEVSDDKTLPKDERKRLQVEKAPQMSMRAKMIKVADKIANVNAVASAPPAGWDVERRMAYLAWTEQVVAGCRGCNTALEAHYDSELTEAKQHLVA